MDSIDPEKYLDQRNQKLWQELSESMEIGLELSKEPNYASYCKGNCATIYVMEKADAASFAHELLHIKIRKDGILAGCCLKRVFQENATLKDIVSEETIIVITNCMEHIKMLPYFLQLGYANEAFIADYNKSKMNGILLKLVKYHLLYGNKNWAFEHLVGWIIAMKADNNPKHNYSRYLARIASFAPNIYSATTDFWDAWLAYDITQTDEWNSPKDFWEETNKFELRLEQIVNCKRW